MWELPFGLNMINFFSQMTFCLISMFYLTHMAVFIFYFCQLIVLLLTVEGLPPPPPPPPITVTVGADESGIISLQLL